VKGQAWTVPGARNSIGTGRNFSFFPLGFHLGDKPLPTANGIFCRTKRGAEKVPQLSMGTERMVKRAQTQEQGPPSAPVEVPSTMVLFLVPLYF
jgi:hypothetical protein